MIQIKCNAFGIAHRIWHWWFFLIQGGSVILSGPGGPAIASVTPQTSELVGNLCIISYNSHLICFLGSHFFHPAAILYALVLSSNSCSLSAILFFNPAVVLYALVRSIDLCSLSFCLSSSFCFYECSGLVHSSDLYSLPFLNIRCTCMLILYHFIECKVLLCAVLMSDKCRYNFWSGCSLLLV